MLIAVLHCREIPEFHSAIKKIPYDQLWINYHTTKDACYAIRQTFASLQSEYTHLAILPDDLIVTYAGIEKLVNNVMSYNLPVHSGVCNVDTGDLKDYLNICRQLPNGERAPYDFIHKDELADSPDLIKVDFSGWPFMILHRSLIPLLSFSGNYKEAAYDYIMCRELKELNVPIVVDHSVRFHHMRYGGMIYTGVKRASIEMILRESKEMESDMQQ